jgi:hypothetical protein
MADMPAPPAAKLAIGPVAPPMARGTTPASARIVDAAPSSLVARSRVERMFLAAAALIVLVALVLGTSSTLQQLGGGRGFVSPSSDGGRDRATPTLSPRPTPSRGVEMPMLGAPTIADGNVALARPTERVITLSRPAATTQAANLRVGAATETDWLKRAALDYQGWHAEEQMREPDVDAVSAIASTLPTGASPASHALQQEGVLANVPQRMPDEVYMKFLHSAPTPR